MMDEHIAIGRSYPGITINTSYSFGLDDQEFVVAFEGDQIGRVPRSGDGAAREPRPASTRCATRPASPARP